ncbi:MAG: 8-amino-7-oxononanoate synthase [Candidatus Omnitrophota bacterium]
MELRIREFLEEREKKGLLRRLTEVSPSRGGRIRIGNKEYINFSSNDYLGLSAHPELARAAQEALSIASSSSASRLMTGSTSLHHELEEKIARFKGKSAALVFNSGYQANVGIISALCGKDDVIFSDRLNHASIIDGIRLSGAAFFRFRHNDVEHLEELLGRERGKFREAMIVTETVFSMDGDLAPISKIARLKKKYNTLLMVDEAHATGVFGEKGSGLVEEAGTAEDVDIIMGTFSKAFGSFGSYVATSEELRDFFVNTCRSFIYSTALPPAVIAANLAALDVVRKEPERRRELLANAEHLRVSLKERGYDVKGSSQIVPIVLGDNKKALQASDLLKEKGYWTLPVRPPTVPQGQARLRISLTYDHARDILDRFLKEGVNESDTF